MKIARKLSRIASAKIVHNKYTVLEMRRHRLSAKQTFIIPHGTYIDTYKNNISMTKARERLRIKHGEFVILFFGYIRDYKGLDDLLDAFTALDFTYARLMIVGQSLDEEISQRIIALSKSHNITYYPGYVADKDVAQYFQASDIVCLPFKTITTSGSIMLSFTFNKPVIAPRIGEITELPDNIGYFYNPKRLGALSEKLTEALEDEDKDKLKVLMENVKIYSSKYSWQSIAQKTLDVYQSI